MLRLLGRTLSFVFFVIFSSPLFAESNSLIVQKNTQHQPNKPPFSIATLTSTMIEIQSSNKLNRFDVIIPKNHIEQLAITRNKNPILSEQIPGKYLSQFIILNSKNNFEKTPIDAQIIVNNKAQIVKIIEFNFTPQAIHLIVKPFSFGSTPKILPQKGAGLVVVHTSCITNRAVCALGCTYVLIPDLACRRKLGIF
jgi:hypothetical protein